jgi:hypothetical protein
MQRTGKWARRAVWATLVVVMCIGCSPLNTIAFLCNRDEPTPAEYPLRPKTGPKHEKDKELIVLVLVGQSTSRQELVGADRELAVALSKRIPEEAKEYKDKITVIPTSQVEKFKMNNINWKAMHPTAIGKKLGADVVLDIHLSNMNLYQPGSGNNIYEGTAEVSVEVYDVTAGPGEPLHKYIYPHKYPKSGMVSAVDAEVPVSRFRMQFLDKLAIELARKHIDHKQSASIASDD